MTLAAHEIGGWTYLLASKRNGTLYTCASVDLVRRIGEHHDGVIPGFTRRYGVTRLVWFEAHSSLAEAAHREQQIKRWRRAWKIALIEENNPLWRDLWDEIAQW